MDAALGHFRARAHALSPSVLPPPPHARTHTHTHSLSFSLFLSLFSLGLFSCSLALSPPLALSFLLSTALLLVAARFLNKAHPQPNNLHPPTDTRTARAEGPLSELLTSWRDSQKLVAMR
jgi:hypothetical protein